MQNPTMEHSFKVPSTLNTLNRSSVSSKPKASQVKRRTDKQNILLFLQEIIEVQEILYSLSDINPQNGIRQDFLYGQRGAPRLSLSDLAIITTFHRLTTLCKPPQSALDIFLNNPDPVQQKTSEHFKLLIEGRHSKPDGINVSYLEGKMLLQRVRRSGYFQMNRLNATTNQDVKEEVKFGIPTTLNPLPNIPSTVDSIIASGLKPKSPA